ncbi:hypothetical protein MHSWG343_10820 [Candidatus Mycoplasma haematohominis]|uniref:Uncharacterized protein n=1 Tax=Candidatus Mycoplasma haematohominis TaxID=1494318 RepID=A0A478FSL3_9MOLU|nr:hypothetical protein MHSWG343_10820 [Candidatus Mycoplasma haemohominis]
MSPQAVGMAALGAAGTGAIGVGTAYATGLIGSKASDKEEEYDSFLDYLEKALKDTSVYIDKSKITTKLEAEDYKTALTNSWNSMNLTEATPDKPSVNEFTSKKTETIEFTSKWCESKKVKKLTAEQENRKWTKATIEADTEWKIFKSVCTEAATKPVV